MGASNRANGAKLAVRGVVDLFDQADKPRLEYTTTLSRDAVPARRI